MPRLNSFFVSPQNWPTAIGETVVLDGPEARHMGTVLRTVPNQTVRLFDGQGHDGLFSIREAGKRRAVLDAVQLDEHAAPVNGITVAIGWGKSKRRKYLLEKSVELQGAGIVFWQANRSQGLVPAAVKDAWVDTTIQAAKQCGATFLPKIQTAPGGIDTLITLRDSYDHVVVAWESDSIATRLSPDMLARGRTLVVIGPEGGFDDDEAQRLIQANFVPVTFGQSILRWETAATYCLSLAMFGIQEAS
ncbi:RsmE family RNA methyltransferase [Pseudodesulfovibrio sp. JC047]|uniref:RsmE family RNA methyltransferase n=1 Tax=Pseudodesulfovibrio sp. JC047 TaxID=2683199 RepID=UPI0013D101EA|nr:RsmE family RNA methyltransferase [Pseudodesulfovibrio sp. JC047]NDV19139.1 RsmE family RNA methyltransferase [Pseudodesulfovibrio sp. JC047]